MNRVTQILRSVCCPMDFQSCPTDPRRRGNWKHQYVGTLALLGLTLGSGNFLYFPGLIAKYNVILLVPLSILMLFVGFPLFTFEMAMGQYLSVGPVKGFGRLAPIFKGLGPGLVLTSAVTSLYYNYYVTYLLMILWRSLLFWTSGDSSKEFKEVIEDLCNFAEHIASPDATPTKDHPIFWEMFWCFLFSWVIVAMCLINDLHASSKLIVVTQVIPGVVLFIIMVLYFDFEASPSVLISIPFNTSSVTVLLEPAIWFDALMQVVFTLSLACGPVSSLSSFNKLHQNFIRDSWIIPATNFVVSYLYTLLISSHFHPEAKTSFTSMICAYTEVESIKPLASLLYLMFFFLTLSCQLAYVDTTVTAIVDSCNVSNARRFRCITVFGVIAAQFVAGVWICFDHYYYVSIRTCGEALFMVTLFCEVFVVWFFSAQFLKVKKDCHVKTYAFVESHLIYCWTLVTPLLVWVIIIWYLMTIGVEPKMSEDYIPLYSLIVFLLFAGSITVYNCHKTENDIFRPTKSFCTYSEMREFIHSPPVMPRRRTRLVTSLPECRSIDECLKDLSLQHITNVVNQAQSSGNIERYVESTNQRQSQSTPESLNYLLRSDHFKEVINEVQSCRNNELEVETTRL